MLKFNNYFASNAGEMNYRENAQSLASVNDSQDSTSELDSLLREAEAETPKQDDVFSEIDAADTPDAFDNEAALQSFRQMLKRGDLIEVTAYVNKTGTPCMKVGSLKTEEFSHGITEKSLFQCLKYINTAKYVELPAEKEGDKVITCTREINEDLFFILLEAGEPLKILPPHKVREGMTIYPYLVGPGGKLRLRLKATEEIIEAIRNRK